MLSVCITRWSTVMSLLLVMSTLSPFLLPTVKSSMVVHDMVRHMLHQPSSNSSSIITTNRDMFGKSSLNPVRPLWLSSNIIAQRDTALPTGLLLGSSTEPFKDCAKTLETDASTQLALMICMAPQVTWLTLLNQTGVSPQEYDCKHEYCSVYCFNLAARTFCTPAQYEAVKSYYKELLFHDYQKCIDWSNWMPAIDSPPSTPSSLYECYRAINTSGTALDNCITVALHKIQQDQFKSVTEGQCRLEYEKAKCITKFACMACDRESALEFLNFTSRIWSPKSAECKEWSDYEPEMKCLDPEGEKCRSMVEIEQTGELIAVSTVEPWIDLAQRSMERYCKHHYYIVYLLSQMACAACASAGLTPYQTYLSKSLEPYRDGCILWSEWSPKLACISDCSTHEHELHKCMAVLNEQHDANKTCTGEAIIEFYDQNLQGKEKVCKLTYFMEKCIFEKMACKYCDNVDTVQQYMKQIWDPSKVECTEWTDDEPTYECTNNVLWIVCLSLLSLVALLIAVVVIVIFCRACSKGDCCASSSRSRGGHQRGSVRRQGPTQGQILGGSMQPVGAMQPVANIQQGVPMQQVGAIQPIGSIQPGTRSMQPVKTLQPVGSMKKSGMKQPVKSTMQQVKTTMKSTRA